MKTSFKLLDITTLKKVTSLFAGNYRTSFHGSGIEFEELREYSFWDDVKNIDWLTSAKIWKPFIRKYQEERELSTLFICDIWSNMQFWIWEKTKLDTLLEAFYILGFSSLKNNDKIWAYFFDSNVEFNIHTKKWQSNVWLIIDKILYYTKTNNPSSSDINIVLKELYNKKIKNNLLFIFSDEYENLDEKYFKALAIKNDIVFINIFDDFENNLDNTWIYNLIWKNSSVYIDIKDDKKKKEYIDKRNEKKLLFKKKILNLGWSYLEITNSTNIYQTLYKFFKLRQTIR